VKGVQICDFKHKIKMLCTICQNIDFDAANCSPEIGGAAHQLSFSNLTLSATNGCELCYIIQSKILETSNSEPDALDDPIFCNIWNWYDGPVEDYKGSSTIVFYGKKSRWSAVLGIAADEGLRELSTLRMDNG
jgi:hypothetical protein